MKHHELIPDLPTVPSLNSCRSVYLTTSFCRGEGPVHISNEDLAPQARTPQNEGHNESYHLAEWQCFSKTYNIPKPRDT